jgi:DNA polymerase-3 subunit gamma/tau
VLREQVKADTMKASYLFFGPRGTGKTSSARIITKAVNCLDLRDGNPCNNCVNCVAINANTTLDVVEIDAASHTGVDNVREEIIAKAGYKPTQLKRKVYIIDEVHMLSKGAFNALLKIMEEPPAYVMFILATTELHKVPDTILSRCQLFQYSRVDEKSMVSRLRTIVDMESLVADDAALKLIAKASGGIMRDAVKYLDQAHILGDITVDTIQSLL